MTKPIVALPDIAAGIEDLKINVNRTLVEISVTCRSLPDKDHLSKSDPMCILYVFTDESEEWPWKEVGKTEIVWNNLNPVFVKKFVLEYHFEMTQRLLFRLYDIDTKRDLDDLSKHDFLGEYECKLSEIVSGNGKLQDYLIDEKNPRIKASIKLVSEELNPSRDSLTLHFRGHKMDKKDTFGKSDPFLRFYRINEDSSFTLVHKTEVIKRTLNPEWAPFTIPVRALCNNDYHRTVKVECHDYNKNGSHELIGEFRTTLRELMDKPSVGPFGKQYGCIHPNKQKKRKKYVNSGTVELLTIDVQTTPTFLDYIGGGTEIQCVIAVDFSPSKGGLGGSSKRQSLPDHQVRMYVTALEAVGTILQDYDSDKEFPAFGFGARLPPNEQVSQFFALNGKASNPYCHEIGGVTRAYMEAAGSVLPHGPNKLAPCIDHTASLAVNNQTGRDYFILLIVTSGIIADMETTIAAIVDAAVLPISIIIVGIGDADFRDMRILDGDDVRLEFRGRKAARDIVQFVPLRDYIDSDDESGRIKGQQSLARAVLEEIPDQLLSYMNMKGFKPIDPELN